MLVRYNHFGIPVRDLLFFNRKFLSNHVVSSNEHSFEEFRVRERGYSFDFLDEDRLAIVLRVVDFISKLLLGLLLLPVVRNRKFVGFALWRLFRVQIVVLFLVKNVKSGFSFPAILVVSLYLLFDFRFVNSWEC